MLLVSRNVSLENISVKFPAFVNLSCCVIFELPLQNKSGIFWLIPEFFLEYERKFF